MITITKDGQIKGRYTDKVSIVLATRSDTRPEIQGFKVYVESHDACCVLHRLTDSADPLQCSTRYWQVTEFFTGEGMTGRHDIDRIKTKSLVLEYLKEVLFSVTPSEYHKRVQKRDPLNQVTESWKEKASL